MTNGTKSSQNGNLPPNSQTGQVSSPSADSQSLVEQNRLVQSLALTMLNLSQGMDRLMVSVETVKAAQDAFERRLASMEAAVLGPLQANASQPTAAVGHQAAAQSGNSWMSQPISGYPFGYSQQSLAAPLSGATQLGLGPGLGQACAIGTQPPLVAHSSLSVSAQGAIGQSGTGSATAPKGRTGMNQPKKERSLQERQARRWQKEATEALTNFRKGKGLKKPEESCPAEFAAEHDKLVANFKLAKAYAEHVRNCPDGTEPDVVNVWRANHSK